MANRYNDDRFQRDPRDRGQGGERDRFGDERGNQTPGRSGGDEARREFGDRDFGNRDYGQPDYARRDYEQRAHRDDVSNRGYGRDAYGSAGHVDAQGGAYGEPRWGRGYEGQDREWDRNPEWERHNGHEGGRRDGSGAPSSGLSSWGSRYGAPYGGGYGQPRGHAASPYGASTGRAPWSNERGSYDAGAGGGGQTRFGRDAYVRQETRQESRGWDRDREVGGGDENHGADAWHSAQHGMQQMFETVKQGVRRAFQGLKGYTRSDERIREDVCDRLNEVSRRANVDVSRVEVRVQDGEVVLSGFIDDRQHKHLMENTAEQVDGVKDVDNQIRVQRPHQGQASSATVGSSAFGIPAASATTAGAGATGAAASTGTAAENGNRSRTTSGPVTGRS